MRSILFGQMGLCKVSYRWRPVIMAMSYGYEVKFVADHLYAWELFLFRCKCLWKNIWEKTKNKKRTKRRQKTAYHKSWNIIRFWFSFTSPKANHEKNDLIRLIIVLSQKGITWCNSDWPLLIAACSGICIIKQFILFDAFCETSQLHYTSWVLLSYHISCWRTNFERSWKHLKVPINLHAVCNTYHVIKAFILKLTQLSVCGCCKSFIFLQRN